ncbi:deoxyribonuclease gamma isoform X3 [Hyperolius riggenbachi]|uniref:deoxyribonuclease gamma isoform X3 n=1 Tax=Hyperolius riggenbachi TaxID=752182 RepID=UPI0035A32DEC
MKSIPLLLALCFIGAASLRICSFNVQILGEAKCAKPEVTLVLQKIISRCDIMLLMEIRDNKDKAIHFLMSNINRKDVVAVNNSYQYTDQQPGDMDVFSREPFIVWFTALNTDVKDFVIIPQHTDPDDAVREIDELYDVFLDVKHKWNIENIILMGDFNAACSYVRKKHWKDIRLRTNQEFVWLIGDKIDTTVKKSTNCAYDRIVLHGEKLISSMVPDSATVFNFMLEYKLPEEKGIEKVFLPRRGGYLHAMIRKREALWIFRLGIRSPNGLNARWDLALVTG